jgi:tRNA pseudouridine38-40 synthase
VPHRFHARHDAVARRYLYQVAMRRTAFAKPFVWWVKEPMDMTRVRRAADVFVGMHDFSSFAVAEQDEESSSIVRLERLEIVEDGGIVLFVVEGSHFLWRMVRRIIGVLVAVGVGDLEPEQAASFLAERSGIPAKLTAPPSGLFLARVFYKGDERNDRISAVTPLSIPEGSS